MSKFQRSEVVQEIRNAGLVPIFYNANVETCKQVMLACSKGGLNVFEFTNRGDNAHEVFRELVRFRDAELPNMKMGAGSIVDAGTTSLYLQLGADFIVSPLLNEDMAKVCNRRKVAWSPGCLTPSEIGRAEELGAEITKLFPADAINGPAFVKALSGPCPWVSIMATGGVTTEEENLKKWFSAGTVAVGMGSQLVSADVVKNKDWAGLEKNVADTLALIKSLRK